MHVRGPLYEWDEEACTHVRLGFLGGRWRMEGGVWHCPELHNILSVVTYALSTTAVCLELRAPELIRSQKEDLRELMVAGGSRCALYAHYA